MKFFTLFYLVIGLSLGKAQELSISEKSLTNTKFDNRYANYSPDGTKIVFESNRDGNWQLYVMDSDGSNQNRLVAHTSNDRRPSWHPSGQGILFESDRSGTNQLYILQLEDQTERQLTSFEDAEPIFGQFSPNGELIAVSLKESEDVSNIVLLDADGGLVERLTDYDTRSFYPRWSSNGSEIVFFSRMETGNQDDEIYKINVSTLIQTRLTNWPFHNFCPSWSADDSKIVYVTSMEGIRPEIYLMDADGSNQTRLTNNEDGDTLPNWSPDGKRVLITGFRNGNFQIIELTIED